MKVLSRLSARKRVIYGDGSELKPMFNPRRRRLHPDTGEITYSRHDPKAIPHHHHKYVEDPYTGEVTCKICESNKKHGKKSKGGLDGALIHEMVALLTRTNERQGRIILDIDLREEHETDANLFTQMFLDLRRNNDELQAMMLIALYDQRLNAGDFDMLQDDGIIVVRKVGNDPRGRIKIRVLHDQTFTLRDGSNIVHDVHIVDGTPALKVYDGNAIEWFVQLEREKIQVNELVNSMCIYTEWRVVDHPLVGTMAGAMVRLRHNSTKEEREKNCRRSVYMRVSPESCPDHPEIYPKREDGESHNATYKNRLDHARVRSIGRIRNQLNLLAFQMNENDKAMYAHFWRTGDEEGYDKRFTYRPERLAEPLLKAAWTVLDGKIQATGLTKRGPGASGRALSPSDGPKSEPGAALTLQRRGLNLLESVCRDLRTALRTRPALVGCARISAAQQTPRSQLRRFWPG